VSHWTGGLAFVAASGTLPKSEHSGTEELGSLQVLVVVVGGGAVLSEQLSKVVGIFAEQIVDAAICSTVAIDVGVGGGSFAGSRCCGGVVGGGGISGFGAAADRKGERKDSHYVVLWWCECCTGLWCFQK
jgi:hypothetical protein